MSGSLTARSRRPRTGTSSYRLRCCGHFCCPARFACCALRVACGIRRGPVQVAAIFPGRKPEPALAGPKETALFGEAEQVGGLPQREVDTGEILLGPPAPRGVQERQERRRFLF